MNIYSYDCMVIGSGAAGFNAACRLKELGVHAAIVTEGVCCGTSRNTGSDKQTYYKLGLGGDASDSVAKMAENLFAGGSMDGDTALCEAALSSRCFMQLCELGVPFPANRYGEYVGYKTDHDPFARATSAGPLTSKFMTEALERRAKQLEVPILDGLLAIEILKNEERVCGLLCLERKTNRYIAIRCPDIILATGGPAGIYADSVYPIGHTGSSGLALQAGAKAQNLALWQYGLASIDPRWNVSGTYMQVLPRFVSIDSEGREYEFLAETFADPYEALSMVFLKGYQWPFDPDKAEHGSSQIDLLVRRECVEKRRRVYLDFTKNPFGLAEIDYEKLAPEAFDYLQKAGACFGTPIERLQKMNLPAIALYQGKGMDIRKSYLEIALCAQHNNGGIAVDLWWQTSLRGLFAAGECAGTHGIKRPGGSALNAGQVGSLRAAQYIAAHPNAPMSEDGFFALLQKRAVPQKSEIDYRAEIQAAARRMSDSAAAIREPQALEETLKITAAARRALKESADPQFYKLRDLLYTQEAVLSAMLAETYQPDGILETYLTADGFACARRAVRPLPEKDDFFENVWRGFRENKNIF